MVRIPGCRSRALGSIPGATRFSEKKVGLEQVPLSLVSIIVELLGRNSSGYGLEILNYGNRGSKQTVESSQRTVYKNIRAEFTAVGTWSYQNM
jgi:hypothetical protein